MAERRMFSKKVTEEDDFMALSASAQALYLHLMMSADDDGFSNQVAISMFRAHASVQDLQSLLERRYLYQFDGGVIVIIHWRMCNALRKDRYTATIFKKELAMLGIDEMGRYVLKSEIQERPKEEESGLPSGCQVVDSRLPDGCQPVAVCLPQVRLGKDSIGKDSKDIYSQVSPPAQLDHASEKDPAAEIITYFNQKTGKHFRATGANRKTIEARLKDGYTSEELMAIIDKKTAAWLKDPDMNKYLKPETLFRPSHVDGYLNEQDVPRTDRPPNRKGAYFAATSDSYMSYDEYMRQATAIEEPEEDEEIYTPGRGTQNGNDFSNENDSMPTG